MSYFSTPNADAEWTHLVLFISKASFFLFPLDLKVYSPLLQVSLIENVQLTVESRLHSQ